MSKPVDDMSIPELIVSLQNYHNEVLENFEAAKKRYLFLVRRRRTTPAIDQALIELDRLARSTELSFTRLVKVSRWSRLSNKQQQERELAEREVLIKLYEHMAAFAELTQSFRQSAAVL